VATILKLEKFNISAKDGQILTKFGTVTSLGLPAPSANKI